MRRAIILLVAMIMFGVSIPSCGESPYAYGIHFWREGANIDAFSGKPGWILFFEDISSYSSINLDKYKDALKEGHTVIVRLNYQGGDEPPPAAETDQFAGQCAYFVDKLKDYAHIFVYANENTVSTQYKNAYLTARYAIHVANPYGYWVPGAPYGENEIILYAGDFCDGFASHSQSSYESVAGALDSTTPAGKTKPIYITEMCGDPPNPPDLIRNTYRSIRDWNKTHAHQVEAGLRFVFFEYYQESSSLLLEPMQSGDFEDAAAEVECANSFANPYVAISSVNAAAASETSATITWTTDVACTGQAEYWKAGDQQQKLSAFYGTNTTSHSVALTNLEPGATYQYVLKNYVSPRPLTLSKVYSFEQLGPGTGTITGYVKSSTGTAIDKAKVTRSPGGYYVYTASNGSYTMKGVPAGSYTLTASEPGMQTVRATAAVTAGGTTTANFAAQLKTNLLSNGGFESGSQASWTGYGDGMVTVNGTWTYGPTPPHTGSWFAGQQKNNGSRNGGLYQQVAVTSGQTYTARAFSRVERENCPWGETYNRLGVEKSGGTDPNSGSVVWTSRDYPYVHDYGEWRLQTQTFTAMGSYATVFIDYKELATAGRKIDCFDDVGLFGSDTSAVSCSDVSTAKSQADGTVVSLSGCMATSGSSDFTDRFYIEDANRTSGIMVYTSSSPWMVSEGQKVDVVGTMTTIGGERAITNAGISMAPGTVLDPIGMVNRSIGGADYKYNAGTGAGQRGITDGFGLNNVGLFITTTGRVQSTGSGYVMVDDGSGVEMRVDTSRVSSPPSAPQYVLLKGISGLWESGGSYYRLLRCRRSADCQVVVE
ncbi:MAG TPA: carboxypeptidase regulatory-like domain-containing protein [Armatimonadota bacterium]|nr:carboxypeptidase regulatory-like domain-containing protein [Armatimonadota bacterium]